MAALDVRLLLETTTASLRPSNRSLAIIYIHTGRVGSPPRAGQKKSKRRRERRGPVSVHQRGSGDGWAGKSTKERSQTLSKSHDSRIVSFSPSQTTSPSQARRAPAVIPATHPASSAAALAALVSSLHGPVAGPPYLRRHQGRPPEESKAAGAGGRGGAGGAGGGVGKDAVDLRHP